MGISRGNQLESVNWIVRSEGKVQVWLYLGAKQAWNQPGNRRMRRADNPPPGTQRWPLGDSTIIRFLFLQPNYKVKWAALDCEQWVMFLCVCVFWWRIRVSLPAPRRSRQSICDVMLEELSGLFMAMLRFAEAQAKTGFCQTACHLNPSLYMVHQEKQFPFHC